MDLTRLRILILGRNEERRSHLRETLRREPGGLPSRVTELAGAAELSAQPHPAFDVAVLALAPDEDAVEQARALARRLPEIPIVAVDGRGDCDPGTLAACGVQEHLPELCACCPKSPRLAPALRWAVERRRLTAQVERLQRESERHALHDPLTGLPNRQLFQDRLAHLLARHSRTGSGFALLFLDLDGFKRVNDTLGHAAGDRLLIEVARRLRAALRDSDTCARWGGDEFLLALEEVASPEAAVRVAQKLLRALAFPIPGAGEARIGASVGISICPRDGRDAALLIRRADEAMYRAKAAGGSAICAAGERTSESAEDPPAAEPGVDQAS
jgi:diguanylate cyclase (GGDEF)-like protein